MAWPALHLGLQEVNLILQLIKMYAMAVALLRPVHLADLGVELLEHPLLVIKVGSILSNFLHHALDELVDVGT